MLIIATLSEEGTEEVTKLTSYQTDDDSKKGEEQCTIVRRAKYIVLEPVSVGPEMVYSKRSRSAKL